MKKSLIHYSHGLGDVIMLTPLLRQLYKRGYRTDLLCRKSVLESSLLKECPYVDQMFIVDNPHTSSAGAENQRRFNEQKFEQLSHSYEYALSLPHLAIQGSKLLHNLSLCKFDYDPNDLNLEVFISQEVEYQAKNFIKKNYPKGYIFNHTMIEFHQYHNWDSTSFIKENFEELPVLDTGMNGNGYRIHRDINFSFVLAREAKHRILSSSVFVHACDAMDSVMDIVNYGRPDRKVWPLEQDKVKCIREANKILQLP